ncbi:hypothetical protein AN958_01391 [Leucoagaricus sp. SymC.cos]|nr:hypothetical protein AN958_01391 [Leucoagaricus sp. SymC.cos]
MSLNYAQMMEANESSSLSARMDQLLSQQMTGLTIHPSPFVILAATSLYGCQLPASKKKGQKKFYVVYRGARMGIFSSWATASASLDLVNDKSWESFNTLEEALMAWVYMLRHGIWGDPKERLCLDRVPDIDIHIVAEDFIHEYEQNGVHPLVLQF